MTYGELQPLGFHRLKVVEFISVLVKSNYFAAQQSLLDSGLFSICFDLFLLYSWNNFLHSYVEQMLYSILQGENDELKLSVRVLLMLLLTLSIFPYI